MTWAGRIGLSLASVNRVGYHMDMKTTEEKQDEMAVSPDVEAIIRQRLATLEEDKKTASPWPEVKRRILERKPQP